MYDQIWSKKIVTGIKIHLVVMLSFFKEPYNPFYANYFSGLHWLQQACNINLASDLESNFITQDHSLINFVLRQNKVVIQFKSGMTLSPFPKCVAYYNLTKAKIQFLFLISRLVTCFIISKL